MKNTKVKTNKQKAVALQVARPMTNGMNHKTPATSLTKISRSFEERFIPRYDTIPAMPEGLPEPSFSESSNKILKERYLLKGGDLQVAESVTERFWHIAYDIASADFDFGSNKKDVLDVSKTFYSMMVRQEFLPNSPTIMNAGKRNGLQYSACFVLPVADSIPEIFDAIKYAALIHQSGGGTGFSFSRLRPGGSVVRTTGGVASGPVSFLRVFNAATESIKQGGTRRGANMGILRIDHPDVLEFIRCKAELDDLNKPVFDGIAQFLPNDEARDYLKNLLLSNQIANFNISVAVTDKFMDAYYKGEDYDLVHPQTKEVVGKLNAKEVFDEIIDRAWHTGDPGVIFLDRINHSTANPSNEVEEIEATNPCGEQPLAPNDACNLGSINLGKFVLADGSGVDWDRLRETARNAVHFLDNVVQSNPYTLKQIYDEVHANRRIGLGVMGWADMLFKLKIAYNSDEAIKLGQEVMCFINDEGHRASEDLAAEKGPFPNWPFSIYKNSKPLRNSTVTTIAPTGTISIIGDCSSGIEPVFALAYLHKAKTTGDKIRTLTIANQTFTEIAKREGFHSDDLAVKVMDHGTVSAVDEVPSDWQKIFVTAQEIAPDWHVKMQAAFQKGTDNGVSKTINLPNSATKDDIKRSYLMAWETDCVGITVYRDGAKVTQVLNISTATDSKPKSAEQVVTDVATQDTIVHRPVTLRGRTYKMLTPVGEAFVTINRDEHDRPFEVFVTIGKAGMQTAADAEALGRMVSLTLRLSRAGNQTEDIAKKIVSQLRGIGGSSQTGFGKERVMSLADAIGKALAEDVAIAPIKEESEVVPLNLTVSTNERTVEENSGVDDVALGTQMAIDPSLQADLCPECGNATFVFEEGCKKCHSCGYSMC